METHVSTVEEVLEKLGWGDGFRIPVANEENRRLQLEIERKTEHKSSLSNELEKLEGRVTKIAKHLNLVALEHGLNQKLLTAHSGQLDAEEHLYRLAENTRSNVRQSARQLQKEKKDLVERISLVESEITKLSAKLKASKTTAEFEKDRLLRWEEILQREDERNQLINRYAKLDEKKFKELELKRQKLEVELKELRGTVFSTFDDVHEMEIFLDRTAKAYVDALSERRRLIDQWSQSVLVLRQRDNGIQDAVREIDTLKEIGREKVDAYNEAVQFFEHQVADNKQLEELIRQLEKKHAMVKDEYRGLLDTIGVYRNEYGTQKKYLEDLSRRAQSMRVKTKKKRFDIESKFLKVEELRKQNNDLRKTFEEISSQQLSIAEREKQFEDMLQREERRKHLIMKETSRIEGLNLRATNRENELESERKALEIRNQAEHKKVNVLAAFHLKEEKRLKDKKEEIYRFDFEIQQCEARLARLTGQDCDKTETDKKQKAFDDLRNVFNEKTEIAKLLQAQITNLEHDMRKISVSLANDRVELQRLKNRKQDLTLMMDGGEKQLKFLKSSNEEKQVEENILRLKLSQAELATSNVGGEVYNLEKYRIHLEAAMQERRAEIKAQKESLNIRKRMSSNECSELRLVISERNARICQLQARYDLNIAAMGNTEDGTPLTVTYLKIQCAQERYLLQEQGDKLDETIRKTEREIQSMENTLRIVNACNENYKANMGAMDEVDPEQEERAKLDLKLLEAIERNANVEAQLIQAKADLKTMQENYLQSINDIASAKEEKDRKQRHLANIERQITEQMQKILRADKCLRKVFKEIQRMCACTEDKIVLLQEGDIAARELQEQNGLALQHITEFTVRHVEAEAYVKNLLATKNMVLPCTTHLMSLTSSMQSLHSSSSRSSSSVSVPPSRNDTITSSKTFTGKLSDTNLQCVAHVLRISPCFGDVNVSGSSRKSVTTVERSVKVSDKSQRDKRSSGKKQ